MASLRKLLKLREKYINECYDIADIDIINELIKNKEQLLLETSATGGLSISGATPVSMGVGVGHTSVGPNSQQSTPFPGNLPGANWIAPKSGSGDVAVAYNPGGKNRIYQKIPAMGKNHGGMTGKKSRAPKTAFSLPPDLKKKRSKVMNYDGFVKNNVATKVTKVKDLETTKVKEGKTYRANKKPYQTNKPTDENKSLTLKDKIVNHIKSIKEIKIKHVGWDLELWYKDKKIAQVMFRKHFMGIIKAGSKFTDEFKYDELGKMKQALNSIMKENGVKF